MTAKLPGFHPVLPKARWWREIIVLEAAVPREIIIIAAEVRAARTPNMCWSVFPTNGPSRVPRWARALASLSPSSFRPISSGTDAASSALLPGAMITARSCRWPIHRVSELVWRHLPGSVWGCLSDGATLAGCEMVLTGIS